MIRHKCTPPSMCQISPLSVRHGASFSPSWICFFISGLLWLSTTPGAWAGCPSLPSGCACDGFYPFGSTGDKYVNISCTRLSLTDIPNFGKDGPSIYNLTLSNNQFTEVLTSHLETLTGLRLLDLSNNQISTIDSGAFSALTNLLYLTLEGNSLLQLPAEIFDISSLSYLNIAANPKMVLPSSVSGTSVSILDISSLQLTEFPADLVSTLDALEELHVENNLITSLDGNVFNNANLKKVYFGSNCLTELTKNTFRGNSKSITDIDFSNNNITTVHKDFLKLVDQLELLDLSDNAIESLPDDLFDSVSNLRWLILANNELSSLEDDIFSNLRELEFLLLGDNQIRSLDSKHFEDLESLTHLDLRNNLIYKLKSSYFENLGQLQFLDVSHNAIYAIKDTVFTNLGNLETFDISNNPLTCQCSHQEVLYGLKYRASGTVTLVNEDEITCTYGSTTYGLLDWEGPCSGYLGEACSANTECLVRNAQCSAGLCSCIGGYFDNNGLTSKGLCKQKVGLHSNCTLKAACLTEGADCIDGLCVCQAAYHEGPAGLCHPSISLGTACSATDTCADANAECVTVCTCKSTHYQDNGVCVEKLVLGESCTANDQCGVSNSQCDLTGTQTCYCPTPYVTYNAACQALSAFFSCWSDASTGDSLEVEFSSLHTKTDSDSCKATCFSQANTRKFYVFLASTSQCLCGKLADSPACSCPSTAPCNKTHLDIQYAGSGLAVSAIPPLVVGRMHEFHVQTTLSSIATVKASFGESQNIREFSIVQNTSFTHTYSRYGLFTLNVSACDASSVCDTASLPVTVQPSTATASMWITGPKDPRVEAEYEAHATVTEGVNLRVKWTREETSASPSVLRRRTACLDGWTLTRGVCVQQTSSEAASYEAAKLQCAGTTSQLFTFNYLAEVEEVISALPGSSASSHTFFIAAQWSSDSWVWPDGRLVFAFSDSDVSSSGTSTGNCVVIDGATRTLTRSDCIQKHYAICMKDPEDCPKGGTWHSDGRCFVTATSSGRNWNDASNQCAADFEGSLAVIDSEAVQSTVITELGSRSEAWIGLTDREFEGYFQWVDNSSLDTVNGYSLLPSSSPEHCVTTFNSKSWNYRNCFSTLSTAVCQYHINNEHMDIPSYQVGMLDLDIAGNVDFLEQSPSLSSTADTKKIALFPGMSFLSSGKIRYFAMKTSSSLSLGSSWKVAFQLYTPVCDTTTVANNDLYPPGCANNRFSMCDTSSHSCPSSNCTESGQAYCSVTKRCQVQSEECSCRPGSSLAACTGSATTGTGTVPRYQLSGQVFVTGTVSQVGQTVIAKAEGLEVQQHDVLALAYVNNENPVECNTVDPAEQTAYEAEDSSGDWMEKDDWFPTARVELNQTCFFQAVHTEEKTSTLPSVLGAFPESGTYNFTFTSPDLGISNSLPVCPEEGIDDVLWLSPPISGAPTSGSSSFLGTVLAEPAVSTDYVMMVGKGSDLRMTFRINGETVTERFSASCPTAVLAALPVQCNASLVSAPLPYVTISYNLTNAGTYNATFSIENTGSTVERQVTIVAETEISYVTLKVTGSSSSSPIILMTGTTALFAATVAAGTGVSYEFSVNGTVMPAGLSPSERNHTFPTAGTFAVVVNASNVHGSVLSNTVVLEVRPAAGLSACSLSPPSAVAGVAVTMQVTCDVVVGAVVAAKWDYGDSSAVVTEVEVRASASPVSFPSTHTFSSVPSGGDYQVRVELSDTFSDEVVEGDVTIYKAIPSFDLEVSKTMACLATNITFRAVLPSAVGDYGIAVTYTWDFDDGNTKTTSTGTTEHAFIKYGEFSVSVNISNGASSYTETTKVRVDEAIADLTLDYAAVPALVNTTVQFTAAQTSGSNISYQFTGEDFSSTTLSSSHSHAFMVTGSHSVTVNASNACNSLTASVAAVVVNDTHLEIQALSVAGLSLATDCLETNTEVEFTLAVLHHNTSRLVGDWTWGDGSSTDGAGLTVKKTYSTASSSKYTVTVTVNDPVKNITKTTTQVVCVQEAVVNPDFPLPLNIGLPSSGSHSETLQGTVQEGVPVTYTWQSNVTGFTSGTGATFSPTFRNSGVFSITLTASNQVSSVSQTKLVRVAKAVEGVVLECSSCQWNCSTCVQTGVYYAPVGSVTKWKASAAHGDDVTYSIDFSDSSSAVNAREVDHTFSAAGSYTVKVTASNGVSSVEAQVVVVAEGPISDVTLAKRGTWTSNYARANVAAQFSATVSPVGVSSAFVWRYSDSLPAEAPSASSDGSHIYTSAGSVNCTVTAQNSISSAQAVMEFDVLEEVTDVNVTLVSTGQIFFDTSEVYYVPKGNGVEFTMNVNTHFGVSYTFLLKRGPMLVRYETPNNPSITLPFLDIEDYTLKASAQNAIFEYDKTFNLRVINAIKDANITTTATTFLVNASIPLKAELSEGDSPTYSWSLASGQSGEFSSTSSAEVTFTPTQEGLYTVSVTISNSLGGQEANFTFLVLTAISGVSIAGNTTNLAVVETLSTVNFTTKFAGSPPFYYHWSMSQTPSSGSVTTATTLTFQFRFPTQGDFTLTIRVSNDQSSASTKIDIQSREQIKAFNITSSDAVQDSSSGDWYVKTNTPLTFSSTLASFDYLLLAWSAESTIAASQTFVHSFTGTGQYLVSLNASNSLESKTNNLTVTAQDEITNLNLTCKPYNTVGEHISLSASAGTGTDIEWLWEVDEHSNINGPTANLSFNVIGEYAAKLTATNKVGVKTISCKLRVVGEIKDVRVTVSQYGFVNYSICFNLDGTNLGLAEVAWALSSGASKTDYSNVYCHVFDTAGTYTLTVTVTNEISQMSANVTFTVTELACTEPAVSTPNMTPRSSRKSAPVTFEFIVNTLDCVAYSLINNWSIHKTTGSCANRTTEHQMPNSVLMNMQSLTIPPEVMDYGNYCVGFQACYNNTPACTDEWIDWSVHPSSIAAVLQGGAVCQYPVGGVLTMDASRSFDPDQSNAALSFAWTCTHSLVSSILDDFCNEVKVQNTANFTINDVQAAEGQNVSMQVEVSAAGTGRAKGIAKQTVLFSRAGSLVVGFESLSTTSTGSNYVSSTTKLVLQGFCFSGCDNSDNTQYTWRLIRSDGVVVNLGSTDTSTGTRGQNLVVNKGALVDDFQYTVQYTVRQGSKSGFSSQDFLPGKAPVGGSCSLSPSTITPLEGEVTVTFANWTNADPMSGLTFIVVVRSSDGTEYTVCTSTQPVCTSTVAPWPGTSSAAVDVYCYVKNDEEISTTVKAGTLGFNPAPLAAGQTKTDHIVNQTRAQVMPILKQNNPGKLIAFLTAVAMQLNDESMTGDDTELTKRMAVRDFIAFAVEGLPLDTTEYIKQLAFLIQLETAFGREVQTQETQQKIVSLVSDANDALSSKVMQGSDRDSLDPDSLLTALFQMRSAGTTSVQSEAETLFGPLTDYRMTISSQVTMSQYSMPEWTVELKLKTMQFTEKLMLLYLQTMVAGEDPIDFATADGNFELTAQRAHVEETWEEVGNGALRLPRVVLAFTSYSDKDVFQIFSSATTNPFGTDSVLNTQVISNTFRSTTDQLQEINVQNLPDNNRVLLLMPRDKGYAVTARLQDSADYKPTANMVYNNYSLEANTEVKVSGFPQAQNDDSAMHVQVRVGFEPSSSDGVVTAVLEGQTLLVTEAMMAGDHKNYTIFLSKGTYDSEQIEMKISSNLKAVVSIGVYFSYCGFYDHALADWASSGCSPTADSIATVASCECNHCSSYGGSVLVAPDAIDFTDLTRLDIASNPVAIITCSILLGLYIGLVILCRRLDILDVKRISVIPLCGKEGSFKYEITVITGRQLGAGTSAHVGIRLIGEYGKTAHQHLYKPGAFQRNCADTFIIAYDVNLGDLQKVSVWHDNSGVAPSWYLSHVIVKDLQTDQKYYFFADCWFTLEYDNGFIQKDLKAAGAADMQRFSRRMKTAVFNAFADKHLWMSLLNRPAQSRFTRVQRATCCATLLYTFIGVNAMWYGLLRQDNNAIGWETFGWEEVVLALVTNLMVFPINIAIVYLFKKSRSKPNFFERVQKPQTAQSMEIDNLCDNSQAGSFQGSSFLTYPLPGDLERESTFGSLPPNAAKGGILRRTKNVTKVHREKTDDSLRSQASQPMWNQDSILRWPDNMPYSEDGDSRPSTATSSGTRQLPAKAGGSSVPAGKEGTKKSSGGLRKATLHKGNWGSLEDILNSDDESTATASIQGRLLKKGTSMASTGSKKKQFNPREDPQITNERNGTGHWPQSRESVTSNTAGSDSFHFNRGRSSADQGITAGLRPGYYTEMTMEERDKPIPVHKEKCTLPPWCVYVAYFLCFVLSAFSTIIVILYCFKFGYEQSLEWVLAVLLSLVQSVFFMEPVKAIFFAVYLVAMFKRVEEDEDGDVIDIQPTFDNSNEKIKDVKFKPVAGFALMQAKDEGRKLQRMNVMVRQFIAYLFYLWLLMVISYVNFQHNSYLMTKSVEYDFINTTTTDHIGFGNISTIEEFWEWSENVFSESLYLQDTLTEEEHGFLLGAARMKQIRGTAVECQALDAAAGFGVETLTDRRCYGDSGFTEDNLWYGEGWNDSTQNLSWRYFSASELGSGQKLGYTATYGGGGYVQTLGTSQSETLAILQHLRNNDWINLRTRAVMLQFALYSPGSDMTAMMSMLVEFPVTGSVVASYEIQSQKLLWFQSGRLDPLMIFEIILLLVAIYSIVHVILNIREQGRPFFKDMWSWYEMLTILMTVISVGLYLGCVIEATKTFNNFLGNQTSFTNYERVAYVHVATRYLHAFLLFLLMFKVVKQLRFIKFLQVFERTLSNAVGLLLGTAVIFTILLLTYAQVGYLMYGRVVWGFESVGHALVTLTVMVRGSFDFWPLLDHQPVFSHFYVYSYYAFVYGLTIALVIAILNDMYKTTRSRMYFKATLEMQDHEMVDFMLKRFKLWAGITKPKPAFRKVKFQGLPSISSRPSSRPSSSTSNSSAFSSQSSAVCGPEFSKAQLDSMLTRLTPTWNAVLKRLDKIEKIEADEENLVKKAETEMSDLNWRIRITKLEKDHKDILSWKPPLDPSKQTQRHGIGARPKVSEDRKPPATVVGVSRTTVTPPAKGDKPDKGKRPLSDQGVRAEGSKPAQTPNSEAKTLQKFIKSIKPSKPAWHK